MSIHDTLLVTLGIAILAISISVALGSLVGTLLFGVAGLALVGVSLFGVPVSSPESSATVEPQFAERNDRKI